ncbi:unnamed protein product, partial [Bubo scandiacus]
ITTGDKSLHVCSVPGFSHGITSRVSDEVKLVGIGFNAFNNRVTERQCTNWPTSLNISKPLKTTSPKPNYVCLGLPCLVVNTSELGGKQLLEVNENHCSERREASGERMKKEKEERAVLLKKQGMGPTPLLAESSELRFCKHRG